MAGSLTEKNRALLVAGVGEVRKERKPVKPSRSAAAALDEFESEARAGASDEFLARASGSSMGSVRAWRKEKRIKRVPRRGDDLDALAALDLGDGYSPTLHTTDDSIDGGRWEPPQYVLREPLNYSAFCRIVFDLRSNGEDTETICAGLGVRPKDVELAIEVWERHLIGPMGRNCTTCRRSYDRHYGDESTCKSCLTSRGRPG